MDSGRLRLFTINRRTKRVQNKPEPDGIVLPAYRKLGGSMTHRADIVWINTAMKKDDIKDLVLAHPQYSLFPVCTGTVDSIVGVLSARSFLESLLAPEWCGLKSLVKKPVYLPETVTLVKTLGALANVECPLAFIIDEYGGIEGIVTRNGIIQELMEEVCDDYPDEDPDIFRREDGSFLVSGHTRMEDLSGLIDLPAAEENANEYYTLAGYILSVHGSIPKTGDSIRAGLWHIEIVDMDSHRIDKVLITAAEDADQEV